MRTVEVRGFPRSFLKHAPIDGNINLANTAKGRITQLAAAFGDVEDVVVMFRARAALVKFATCTDATKMVESCASSALCVPTLTKLQQKAPPVALQVTLTEQEIFRKDATKMTDAEKSALIDREVRQIMGGMIKILLNQNAAVNRTRRLSQRQKHSNLLAVIGNERGKEWEATSSSDSGSALTSQTPICWDYLIAGAISWVGAGIGRWSAPQEPTCARGSSCDHRHPSLETGCEDRGNLPFIHLPVHWVPLKVRSRLGSYLVHDNFATASREGHMEKEQVNQELCRLLFEMAGKHSPRDSAGGNREKRQRCLVLDGAGLGTTKTLLGDNGPSTSEQAAAGSILDGLDQTKQTAELEVVVPNPCTATYLAIQEAKDIPEGACTAFHGTLRAYVDQIMYPTGGGSSSSRSICGAEDPRQFQLVYCDYCCSLFAGRRNMEKSPVHDLTTLFAHRLFDPAGCVLAVTLAKPDLDTSASSTATSTSATWDDSDVSSARSGRPDRSDLVEKFAHQSAILGELIQRLAARSRGEADDEDRKGGRGQLLPHSAQQFRAYLAGKSSSIVGNEERHDCSRKQEIGYTARKHLRCFDFSGTFVDIYLISGSAEPQGVSS